MSEQNSSSSQGQTPFSTEGGSDALSAQQRDAIKKMQEALRAAQEASAALAQATQEASLLLGEKTVSQTTETQESLDRRANELLRALQAEEAARSAEETAGEVTSQSTGQLYFTTTISNVESNVAKQNSDYFAAVTQPAPQMPNSYLAELDDSGLDVTVAPTPTPTYTDPKQFTGSGFFAEGNADLATATDFASLQDAERPTPKVPYFIYLIFGVLAAIACGIAIYTVPSSEAIESSNVFMPVMVIGAVLFVIGALMWFPVWISSRERTSNQKGLFARAFMRAALCTTLITFLWIEALVISDMLRLGQLTF